MDDKGTELIQIHLRYQPNVNFLDLLKHTKVTSYFNHTAGDILLNSH